MCRLVPQFRPIDVRPIPLAMFPNVQARPRRRVLQQAHPSGRLSRIGPELDLVPRNGTPPDRL